VKGSIAELDQQHRTGISHCRRQGHAVMSVTTYVKVLARWTCQQDGIRRMLPDHLLSNARPECVTHPAMMLMPEHN
jgi:hypothetical protein